MATCGMAASFSSSVGATTTSPKDCPRWGGREEASEVAPTAAIDKDDETKEGWEDVTRLYRGDNDPEDRCWLRATDWSLAYD
jgi:protein-L-isoaspartate(D-aspartate) O-methyltransferase